MEIKNFDKRFMGGSGIRKEYRDKKPEQRFTTFEEFSKRWRGFLKGANIENWKDDYTNYLMEKYR